MAILSFAVIVGVGVLASIRDLSPTLLFAVGLLAIPLFVALAWLWVYWLIFFHRANQRDAFRLCFCLPYIYSFFKTIAVLRASSKGGA